MRLNNSQWWTLVVVSLLIVFAWPPRDDKSLDRAVRGGVVY
jgi:hypothetical protein